MLSLPEGVKAVYDSLQLPEVNELTHDKIVENLQDRMDFVVVFFKSVSEEKKWLDKEENQVLVHKIITKLEGLALTGELSADSARKVHAAIVEANFGNLLSYITCNFSKKKEPLQLNKLLFNSICEHSRSKNFQKVLHWGDGSLAFKESDYTSIQFVLQWLASGELDLSSVEPTDITRVIGELLYISHYHKIEVLASQLMTHIFGELTAAQRLDVFIYVGTNDMLSLANELLEEHFNGISIQIDEKKQCSIAVESTEQLMELWKTNKELAKNIFLALSNHELNIHLYLNVNLNEENAVVLEELFASLGKSIRQATIKLEESSVDLMEQAVNGIIALLCDMQNLKHLQIDGNKCVNLTADHFQSIAAICPPVSSLAFNDCLNANNEHMITFATRAGNKLEHLRVNACGSFTDEVAEAISESCDNIKAFYFDSGSMDSPWDVSEAAVIQMFSKCKKLDTLRFLNSENAPPCDHDPFDLGILNILQKRFPSRQVKLNYSVEDYF